MTRKEIIMQAIGEVEDEAQKHADEYSRLDVEISILLTRKAIARKRVDTLTHHISDLKTMYKACS
jgi:hypothetical protein